MAGLAGIFRRDHEPCDPQLLEAMRASLRHRGDEYKGVWRQGHIALAANGRRIYPESANEHQPCVDAEAGIAVVFDGRLDNRDELFRIGSATANTPKDSPDVALVLAVFKETGDAFAKHLLGDFACAIYDYRQESLYLARDPIGVRPLYYSLYGNVLVFGSEIRCLVIPGQPKPMPDYDLLSEFLLLRRLAPGDDRSYFANVKSVRPGSVLKVTTNRLIDRTYWDFNPAKTIRYPHYSEYVEEFKYRFEQALLRRLRSTSDVGVSLSGGLDSSSLFCMAKALNAERQSAAADVVGAYMDYGADSPADEDAHVKALEQCYGIAIERIHAKELSYFSHGLEPVIQSETPIGDVGWSTARSLREYFASRGVRVMITGHWGDQVLFEQRYLIDLLRSMKLKTLVNHLTQFGRWYQDADSAYFRRQFYRDALRYLLPVPLVRMARAIRGQQARPRGQSIYSDEFAGRATKKRATRIEKPRNRSEHATAIYQQVRCRSHQIALDVTNKVANHSGLEFAYPYLDRELVEYLMAVPGHIATRNGVPKALLRDALAGHMPESVRGRNWKADTTFIEYAALREQLPSIRRYLSRAHAVYDHRISSPAKVATALEEAKTRMEHGADVDWSLEYFLGACQWLDAFDFRTLEL